MSPEFPHYNLDIETIDPDIDKVVEQLVEFWETKARRSPTTEGTGRAVRGAHAKSFGLAKAEVQFLHSIPAPYAQGIYATPGCHGALIRFSSSANHLGTDAQLGSGLGYAIKIFDIPGTKLTAEEQDATTFDLVLKNNPVFIANSAKHYLVTEEIVDGVADYLARGKAGFHELLSDFLTCKGTLDKSDWAWDELFAFVRVATQTPVRNPLLTRYSTMGAVRHGDYMAKVGVAPTAESAMHAIHHELDLHSGAEVFHPTLVDELQARAFDFDLQVQLCTDLEATPVNNATVEWPESVSPFVTVARVHIPRQDISGPENAEKSDSLAFNQWRVTEEHRPLGEIMQVRQIYSSPAKVRRTLNNQSQLEPATAESVLSS